LCANNTPLEYVKEINEKRYYKLKSNMIYLQKYNIFIMAKNLGINFSPSDISIEDLHIFNTIQTAINEVNEGKNHGTR